MRVLPQKVCAKARAVVPGGRTCTRATAVHAAAPTAEDPYIAKALALAPPASTLPASLRTDAASALATARMPTTRNELYRFTDISPLLRQSLQQPPECPRDDIAAAVERCTLPAADASRIVIIDGRFAADFSNLSGLPAGISVSDNTPDSPPQAPLGTLSCSRGGVFAMLNAATCAANVVIAADAHLASDTPLHIIYISTSAEAADTLCTSSPRVLIALGEAAKLEVVEEFVALDAAKGGYHVNAVLEAVLGEGARLKHRYVEVDAGGAFHVKATLVEQAASSCYSLVEARLGATLSRHDVSIAQQGEQTETEMKHFVLCGERQLHDLHTELVLDHPEGVAQQLHKCIVTDASARGVFDGSVQVRKRAQRTDAGQLSRNLLLAPKATVNVKPNLQIIADDVKCTHGCAVSDLSPDELFYFRSRGIDAEAARKALVFSFGAEVVQHLSYKELVERLQGVINAKLGTASS